MDILNTNISLINILSWVVFGFIVGTIAHWLDPKATRGGVIATIITGIIGALLGGFLANLVFGLQIVEGFNIQTLIIATLGALILAFVQRLVFRERGHIRTKVTRLR